MQHEQTSTARTAPEAPARVPPKVPIPPAVLLSPDSPLHARPAALHRRQALALDGISDSIDMTIIAYRQLRVALWTDMQMIDQPASRPVYLQTIMSAWTIVDAAHRLRVLVRKLPGLKNGPAKSLFLKAVEQVERLRHAVQHLDGEIEQLLANGQPLWGFLTWVKADGPDDVPVIGILLPGALGPTWEVRARPFGRDIEVPIGLIELTAAGMTVSLTDVVAIIQRFARSLERAAAEAFSAIPAGATNFRATFDPSLD